MKITIGTLSIQLLPIRGVNVEDWVVVRAIITTDGFAGDFEAQLQLADLERFDCEVGAMYDNVGQPLTAELSSAEPGVWLQLKMRNLGGVASAYRFECEDSSGASTMLSGSFEMDQSYLPALRASVNELAYQLKTGSRS